MKNKSLRKISGLLLGFMFSFLLAALAGMPQATPVFFATGIVLDYAYSSTDKIGMAFMPLGYGDLLGPSGIEDNIGGLTTRVYWAPKSYFDVIQAVKDFATAASPDELAEITADHTFQTGKGFHEIYSTRDTGEIKFTGVGERDGRATSGKAEIFYPGVNATALGTFRMMKNDKGIFLFELADGQIIQAGSARFPAETRVSEAGSAKNESGVRGSKLEIDFFESGMQIYSGAITLFP